MIIQPFLPGSLMGPRLTQTDTVTVTHRPHHVKKCRKSSHLALFAVLVMQVNNDSNITSSTFYLPLSALTLLFCNLNLFQLSKRTNADNSRILSGLTKPECQTIIIINSKETSWRQMFVMCLSAGSQWPAKQQNTRRRRLLLKTIHLWLAMSLSFAIVSQK